MFEQSILQPETDKKPWTFAASVLVEVCVVSVSLLIPLIYTERLGLGWIQSSALPTPRPRIPKPVLEPHPKTQSTHRRFNFHAVPLTVPTRPVVALFDEPIAMSCTDCVANAIPQVGPDRAIGIGGPVRVEPPPPKPQPKPTESKKPVDTVAVAPVRVSLGAQEAKIIRRVIPTYPALAKQVRVQGTVKLLGVISTEGRIEKLQVISGHPLLIQAAVDAVKQWTYRPTLLSGQPVEVMAPIDVNFILSN